VKHPHRGSKVKLIYLEGGYKAHKKYLGRMGEVISVNKYGTRRFYGVRFEDEILYLYRPEIENVDENKDGEKNGE
jgi:hypothetical protein